MLGLGLPLLTVVLTLCAMCPCPGALAPCPGGAERHRGEPTAPHRPGGLPQPASGENRSPEPGRGSWGQGAAGGLAGGEPWAGLRLCASRLTLPSLSLSGLCGPCCPRAVWPQDYVQALTGFCYDGVEGLIYLALFSFVTALMFSSIVCSVPHTWQQKR